MGERVALYGGAVDTGPRIGGGYEVRANIPLGPTTPPRDVRPREERAYQRVEFADRRLNPWLDRAIAGVALVALEAEAFTGGHRQGPLLLNVLAVAAMAVAALWRRRMPLAFIVVVGALSSALSSGLTSLHYATVTGLYSAVIPLYAVAAWANRLRATLGLVGWVCGAAAVGIVQHGRLGDYIGAVVMGSAAWATGQAIRSQRELAAELEGATRRLAAEREDRARLAVAGERTRIARELHALVARGVIAMIVQAEAAQNLLGRDETAALAAMGMIEQTGRDALAQMRRILGALRGTGHGAELQPQPGLDQIHTLIQRSREAGLPVELAIEGEPGTLFGGVDLVTYRILEELLHSAKGRGHNPIVITVRFGEDDVELDFSATNLGRRDWPTPTIRERVALCDGEVTLASNDDHDTRLIIRLPRRLQGALT